MANVCFILVGAGQGWPQPYGSNMPTLMAKYPKVKLVVVDPLDFDDKDPLKPKEENGRLKGGPEHTFKKECFNTNLDAVKTLVEDQGCDITFIISYTEAVLLPEDPQMRMFVEKVGHPRHPCMWFSMPHTSATFNAEAIMNFLDGADSKAQIRERLATIAKPTYELCLAANAIAKARSDHIAGKDISGGVPAAAKEEIDAAAKKVEDWKSRFVARKKEEEPTPEEAKRIGYSPNAIACSILKSMTENLDYHVADMKTVPKRQ